MTFTIEPVRNATDLKVAARLFCEYAEDLGEDLCFQGFEQELATLPGCYAPPEGDIFLAKLADGTPAGCVAFRPMADVAICEMKRMYVPPAGRGQGIGRALVKKVLAAARAAGYHIMRLDTLPRLEAALHLYADAGFSQTSAYYQNPLPGVVYLQKQL
ncbi:GNAT family N-acetyltransferase [Parvularcula sp. IMCC14364]|uniref:GNAT family N-acetyltransferase n=1 Tax=Parvularcula sp. IMCC14364 TaxID=3067902 RepID=UPI00274098F6|nr:GNAT family N-acetyltransferase [Parvularcula sp. IMCC14364]